MMWFLNDDILRNLPTAVHEQCHANGMTYLKGGATQNKFYLGRVRRFFTSELWTIGSELIPLNMFCCRLSK